MISKDIEITGLLAEIEILRRENLRLKLANTMDNISKNICRGVAIFGFIAVIVLSETGFVTILSKIAHHV